MLLITLYITSTQAVRKTADDCRRLVALMDSLAVLYEVVLVDTAGMRTFVEELTGRQQLPLLCVGELCVGTYDEVMDLVEDGALPRKLRECGYAENIRGAPADLVASSPTVVKKTIVVKKTVVVKKPREIAGTNNDDGAAVEATSSNAVTNDEDVPPPPPTDDDPPPPPMDDDLPPPPMDDEDIPPPPPDDDPPPPPMDDDDVPPPPPE